MRKKLLSIILSIAVILTSTVTVFAEDETFTHGDFTYRVTSPDTVEVIGGNDSGIINIPETATNISATYTVRGIGDSAFAGSNITKVVFSGELQYIGDSAFAGCSNLANITMSSGLLDIGKDAFKGCTSLVNITIPDTVTNIREGAFSNCSSLKTVFCDGDTPAKLGVDPFASCEALTAIYVKKSYLDTYKANWSIYSDKIQAAKTVSDILPSDFPTSYDNGWQNTKGNGFRAYLENDFIYFTDNDGEVSKCPTLANVIPNGDNYELILNPAKITFIMSNGVLTGITFAYSGSTEMSPQFGTYEAPVTIAEILATVEGGFPNTYDAGWRNGNGSDNRMYATTNNLILSDSHDETAKPYPIEYPLIPNGNNYEFIETMSGGSIVLTTTFVMDNGTLSSINIEINTELQIDTLGTYTAPPITEVNINYTEFDFLNYTMKSPAVPSTAKYKIFQPYWLSLFNGSEPVAYLSSLENIWVDPTVLINRDPVDPSQLNFDAGSIFVAIHADDGQLFDTTGLVVKANDSDVTPLDYNDENIGKITQGEIEGYTLDPDNPTAVLMCLMFKRYEITEGKDAVINVDNNKDVLFASNADYDKFYKPDEGIIGKVLVDDELVDPSNYTHTSGSTEVTLKASYLKTLGNGKHALTIVSSDGNASTYFTITRNPKPNPGYIVPNTGVN